MAGFLAYLAFVAILSVWALGWMTFSVLVGLLLKVPPKTSVSAGLLLGPLGVLYVAFSTTRKVDVSEGVARVRTSVKYSFDVNARNDEDPFQ